MKCIDCGNRCTNKCSGCGRPYCAHCRDASGYARCLFYCRTNAVARSSASKVAQQRAKQAQSALYTPPPSLAHFVQQSQSTINATPPQIVPAKPAIKLQRSAIYLMDKAQFDAWKKRTIDGLHDVLLTRAAPQDFDFFADLIEAVQELEILREWAEDNQSAQQGGNTGMMLPYDGKLKI